MEESIKIILILLVLILIISCGINYFQWMKNKKLTSEIKELGITIESLKQNNKQLEPKDDESIAEKKELEFIEIEYEKAVTKYNAITYDLIVNVVEGENVMGVNPLTDNLDFGVLSRNNGMTRYITLKNEERFPIFVAVFKFGEIAKLVEIDKEYFLLEAGKETKLAYEVQIPPSAEIKKYSGWTAIFRLPMDSSYHFIP